ncbi:MAG: DUF6506 family protein [Anaerolineae bacterium]
MAFKALFLAHAPDADPETHQCFVETPTYQLFVRVVQNQAQAVAVCRRLAQEEGIHAVLLCPGFTHKDIAELAEALGPGVGVFVARGDSPSNAVVMEVMAREGWFRR